MRLCSTIRPAAPSKKSHDGPSQKGSWTTQRALTSTILSWSCWVAMETCAHQLEEIEELGFTIVEKMEELGWQRSEAAQQELDDFEADI